jgi:hypothetical protein
VASRELRARVPVWTELRWRVEVTSESCRASADVG